MDKRQPPPNELLKQLGPPYTKWRVYKGPFDTSILQYPFIEGDSYNVSVAGWIQVLLQIKTMHALGFVRGDLLPRNVLFDKSKRGYVIDFDLSRKVGAPYVRGFNRKDFLRFRHTQAEEGGKMIVDLDLHSLRQMRVLYVDLNDSK